MSIGVVARRLEGRTKLWRARATKGEIFRPHRAAGEGDRAQICDWNNRGAMIVMRSRRRMEAPIKYFKCPDGVHLAYRIFGDGPRDIVLVPGTLSHAEMTWERPAYKHLLDRLTAFARVIVFDKRGQGLSDRNVAAEQTIEERIIDIKAVMDAAGSERAAIYGWSEGGPTALVFSATYPERTSALVLYATFASLKDPPWSISRELWFSYVKSWEEHWGTGILLELNAPSVWVIPAVREETGRWERATASPGSIGALMRL